MFPMPTDIEKDSCPVLQSLQENFRNAPDEIVKELEQDHKARCQKFAAETLPGYRGDPSTWPPHSFDKVLSLIIPYIGYLRLLGSAAAKYPNLDQLQEELASLPTANDEEGNNLRRVSYVKQAFENNPRLHSELITVVSESSDVRSQ